MKIWDSVYKCRQFGHSFDNRMVSLINFLYLTENLNFKQLSEGGWTKEVGVRAELRGTLVRAAVLIKKW